MQTLRLCGSTRAATAAPRRQRSLQVEDLPGLGPRPTTEQLSAALARNEAQPWAARQRLYDHALDYPQAAARLGLSRNQITNLVSAGELLTVAGPDGKRLPAWQFHPEAPRGRLPGIAKVAAAYPGRILGLSGWMTTRHPSLGGHGRTPADALADGDIELVVAESVAGRAGQRRRRTEQGGDVSHQLEAAPVVQRPRPGVTLQQPAAVGGPQHGNLGLLAGE